MADLNKLVEKIKADAELKKQFAEAVKENKVVEFCKTLGIETTKEEIGAFLNAAKKQELSDAELNRVSGGCNSSKTEVICDTAFSICTVGAGCALVSLGEVGSSLTHRTAVTSCLGDD